MADEAVIAASAEAFEFDCSLMNQTRLHSERLKIVARPLWPESREPLIFEARWTRLRGFLDSLGSDWDVWGHWFDGLRTGERDGLYLFGLPTARALQSILNVARIDDALWMGDPALLNAEFKRLVGELRAEPVPLIPDPKPSTIDAVWREARLVLSPDRAEPDGDADNIVGALRALKAEFEELLEDAEGEANIDRRAIAFLQRLAARIPAAPPSSFDLHRLALHETALLKYCGIVSEQWPETLAARYFAVALQFNRTMDQFPNWRDFKRIASAAALNAEQLEAAPALARALATELRNGEIDSAVDPAIPGALEDLATLADERGALEVGADLLAADLVHGVETILIRIAEAALAAARGLDTLRREAWDSFAKRARKSIVQEAGKAGGALGPFLFKWLKRCGGLGLSGSAVYAGAPHLSQLVAKYPGTFSWLNKLILLLPG